ncbi:MAG: hypothetical protein AAGA54_35765 [Myxococcota bacterium]
MTARPLSTCLLASILGTACAVGDENVPADAMLGSTSDSPSTGTGSGAADGTSSSAPASDASTSGEHGATDDSSTSGASTSGDDGQPPMANICAGGQLPVIASAPCTFGMCTSGASYRDREAPPARIGSESESNVYIVTNRDDDGPGSLRHAVETANEPRFVLFDVAGEIELDGQLNFSGKSHIHIAGQSAPGVVRVVGDQLNFVNSHDIVVEHIDIVPMPSGPVTTNTDGTDAITVNRGNDNLVLSNMGLYLGNDEIFDVLEYEPESFDEQRRHTGILTDPADVTLHRSIVGYGVAGINELAGGLDRQSKGSITGGNNYVAFTDVLFTSSVERNPKTQAAQNIFLNVGWFNTGLKLLDLGEAEKRGEDTSPGPAHDVAFAVLNGVYREGPIAPFYPGAADNRRIYTRGDMSAGDALFVNSSEYFLIEGFEDQASVDLVENRPGDDVYTEDWDVYLERSQLAEIPCVDPSTLVPDLPEQLEERLLTATGPRPSEPSSTLDRVREDYEQRRTTAVVHRDFDGGDLDFNTHFGVPPRIDAEVSIVERIPVDPFALADNGYTNIENFLRELSQSVGGA